MTRQQIVDLFFLMFVALWIGLIVLLHLSDPAVGVIPNQYLLRSMNLFISLPAAIFGAYSIIIGLRALRAGEYPPPKSIVPFPSMTHAALKASTAGFACIFLGLLALSGPLLIFKVAVCPD